MTGVKYLRYNFINDQTTSIPNPLFLWHSCATGDDFLHSPCRASNTRLQPHYRYSEQVKRPEQPKSENNDHRFYHLRGIDHRILLCTVSQAPTWYQSSCSLVCTDTLRYLNDSCRCFSRYTWREQHPSKSRRLRTQCGYYHFLFVISSRYVDVRWERLSKAIVVRLYLVHHRCLICRAGVINSLCRTITRTCSGTSAAFLLPGSAYLDRNSIHMALSIII